MPGACSRSDDPVAAVPVYLEAYDSRERKRLGDVRTARTNERGEYEFAAIVPGEYRIISTFEFEPPDEELMDTLPCRKVSLAAGEVKDQPLELYSEN